MNDIRFTKTNGGMGRAAANEDPVSGLLMCLPELAEVDLIDTNNTLQFDKIENVDGNNPLYVAKLRFPEALADYGISEQAVSMSAADYTQGDEADELMKRAAFNTIVYHVTEFFRMNAEGTLYLSIKIAQSGNIKLCDIVALQNYAGGSLRQCGVFTPALSYLENSNTIDILVDYQNACTALENTHKPMSIIATVPGITVAVSVNVADMEFTPTSVHAVNYFTSNRHVSADRCNVSLLIGCDLDGGTVQQLAHYAYYGCIGTCLGAVSKAAVHESIAWVQKFPLGLKAPGFISGDLLKDVSDQNQNLIDDNRYIFVRTHVGDADNYFNDSHTLDLPTSDYAFIENVRTIDKACRGVRANLLPYLNSPLKVDAETGRLDAPTVAFLETTAGKALEDMEKAGELSGYRAEIDPEQDVLGTSQVEVVIRNVPMGVMRKVHVKIGFTTSL